VREFIRVGIEVELINHPDWDTAAMTLVAEYDLKVAGLGFVGGTEGAAAGGTIPVRPRNNFSITANRVHPVYFHYPFEKADDVTIQPAVDLAG